MNDYLCWNGLGILYICKLSNNNNDFIFIALFCVQHAQLH